MCANSNSRIRRAERCVNHTETSETRPPTTAATSARVAPPIGIPPIPTMPSLPLHDGASPAFPPGGCRRPADPDTARGRAGLPGPTDRHESREWT
ncbi:hypothetical protein GCM10010308_19130 [Streptomyces vinaceusdrappus]|nr:hypothetical protein GCM10010308_19130 [Streptomyces vinaceusdrappus]